MQRAETHKTIKHPALHPNEVSSVTLTIALIGAPFAWVAQMLSSEILSSYACYPHGAPIAHPLWQGLTLMLSVISIACIIIGFFSVICAQRAWQSIEQETNKDNHHVINVGEGRTKFLAMLSILSSVLFTIAIIFSACALLLVSPCGA